MMIQIEIPASVRWVLLLTQILNYMLIEALFLNTRIKDTGECFLGVICVDQSWLVHRFVAIVLAQLINAPAMRVLPRVFYSATHLSSATTCKKVQRTFFRPTLSYIFESRANRKWVTLKALVPVINDEDSDEDARDIRLNRSVTVAWGKTQSKKVAAPIKFTLGFGQQKPMKSSRVVPQPQDSEESDAMSSDDEAQRRSGSAKVDCRSTAIKSLTTPKASSGASKNAEKQPDSPNAKAFTRSVEFIQSVREDELRVWRTDPKVRSLRRIQLIICWTITAIFTIVPFSFCMTYAAIFPDHYTAEWIVKSLQTIVIGLVLSGSVTVFVSFALGWLYVKFDRYKRSKKRDDEKVNEDGFHWSLILAQQLE